MANMTIQEALTLALTHHKAGRLAEAEALYRAILTEVPNHPDALQMLGVLASNVGRHDMAVDLIRRAIAFNPSSPVYFCNLALAHAGEGNLPEAIAAYRQALKLNPQQLDAVCGLGNALYRAGEVDESIACYRRGLELKPASPELLNNLGTGLQKKGSIDEAIACFRRAIELGPHIGDPYSNLGNALFEKGQPAEALALLEQAAALSPNNAEIQYNLANVLRDRGRTDEAIARYRRAVALRPSHSQALNNLGNLFKANSRIDESMDSFRSALAINPADVMALNNLGDAYHLKGNLSGAEACCRRAIEVDPNLPVSHWDLALILLLQGRLTEGWKEYAWRRKVKEFDEVLKKYQKPLWDGKPFRGKTLLLHTEQGFGDTLQFIRYVPALKARGGRIICVSEPELIPLLRAQVAQIDQWLTPHEKLPAFDLHCSLLDLPMVMETALENIPAAVPYLSADPQKQAQWRERMSAMNGLKVGIAWAGKPIHRNDRNRSIALADLAPLLQTPGTVFFSLQKGSAAAQVKSLPPDLKINDWTDELKDFADTAALLANLDLVISVDTAVAHLAGAMAKPVWVLLPFASDWRWMAERADSPWYPTMRLFRQQQFGQWSGAIDLAARSLQEESDSWRK